MLLKRLKLIALPILVSGALSHAQIQSNDSAQISVQASCGRLTLTPIAKNAIRVRCGERGTEQPELVFTQSDPVTASHGMDAHGSWISAGDIRADFDRQTGKLSFHGRNGQLLVEQLPAPGAVEGVRAEPRAPGVEASFSLAAGEHLFGSGQFQDGNLDIARLPRRLLQVNTQIAIPFFVSSRGYGLLWHQYGITDLNRPDHDLALQEVSLGQSETVDVTTSTGTQRQKRQLKQFAGEFLAAQAGEYALQLDLGRTMTDRWTLFIDDKPAIDFKNLWLPGVTGLITHLSAGPHRVRVEANTEDHPSLQWGLARQETHLRSPDGGVMDYTIFAGDPDQVISTYRRLAGGSPMLPKWAFGFIQCRERYTSSDEILDTVHRFRKEQLPFDLIVQDWQYWGKYGWNAMRFDETHYPDPRQLVNDVHANNAHLMVSVWSKFDPASEVGKQFQARGYFVPGTTWVDFLNPEAAKFYWSNFSSRMASLGIDSWWLDATEPENDALHQRNIFPGRGDAYRLVYPLFVTKTVYEGLRRDFPDRRVMILTRSAFPGEQRYGISTWSGDIGNDWDTLRRQVVAGLDYAASGMPYWTTDTGGFFRPAGQFNDPEYHERFIRWLEFSTFSPLMRVHGYQTRTEPWNYSSQMVEQERSLIDLRYRLLPYIYSHAAEVSSKGSTLMRPLVMDFSTDDKALDQKYEYMFGPAFLVAPVLEEGTTTKSVYLPKNKGGWYDWWTGRHLNDGADVMLDAPLMQIPLLIRAGSIVPLSSVQQYTDQLKNPDLELRVYPGRDGQLDLYDDDGISYAYEQGQRAIIAITWNDRTKKLQMGARHGSYPNMPLKRVFNIRFYGPDGTPQERQVTYDGHAITASF